MNMVYKLFMTITGLVWSTSRLKVDSDITCTLFLRLTYEMQRFRKMLMIAFIVVCCYWFLLHIYTPKLEKCYKIIIIFLVICPTKVID